jgi:prepilin-type N-terminal cleavage/methylation domain-containing protein
LVIIETQMIADNQNADEGRYYRGFTLIEMLIVLLLSAMLSGVTGLVFLVSLRAWDSGCRRTGIREDISYAAEKVVRDLKEMALRSLSQYSSIAHTVQYNDFAGNTYVFYLYNADDSSFDSTYSESLYNLRKANTSQGDNPALGDGVLILRDLVSPDAAAPATALSINPNGTQVTIDFVVQRSDEIVRIRTKIRPRNL